MKGGAVAPKDVLNKAAGLTQFVYEKLGLQV